MNRKLIALAVIAMGALSANSPEVAQGATFEAPDDVADDLVAKGQAKLADAAPAAKAKAIKVRLLADCEHGKANDVRELLPEVARALVKAGEADDDKAAVAYASGLPQNEKKAT